MALSSADLAAIETNLGSQLANANDLLLKSHQYANGGIKTFRDFRDIASMLNITRNQERQEERNNYGIVSLAERIED